MAAAPSIEAAGVTGVAADPRVGAGGPDGMEVDIRRLERASAVFN